MYNAYITECPAMAVLFWQFVSLKYPDEPQEIHELSSRSLNTLNEQLHAINGYLRELAEDDDISFSNFDEFITHVLDNYPSTVDPDVLNIYLESLESIVNLIGVKFTEELVILDRDGSVIISQE